jgi:phage baseplate assembly protein V
MSDYSHQATTHIGLIIERDLANAAVRVKIDDDYETDWLPWRTSRAGSTRTWSPPSLGEQVAVICPYGDIEGAYVDTGLYSDDVAPPTDRDVDLIDFADGARVEYDAAAHHMKITLPAGGQVTLTADSDVTINAQGGLTINGPVTINGDLTTNGKATITDDATIGGIGFLDHTHDKVKTGTDVSGKPQ